MKKPVDKRIFSRRGRDHCVCNPRELLAESFNSLVEKVGDIIVVGSSDGKILFANPACVSKLGYSHQELLGMHILDLHPPDKRREAAEIFSAMFRGEMEICPLPLQCSDGALLPVETKAWVGTWGGVDCVFGISHDLRSEQEALQKFDRLFRNNPALMAVSNLQDRIFVDVNDSWLKTLGYTRNEVIGNTSERLGLFVTPQKQREVAEKLQAEGCVRDVELQVRCKDGSLRDGLFWGEIIESQGKKYILTLMIDQTDRKCILVNLKNSQLRYQAIVEDQTELICRFRTDGVLTFVNNAYCKYFGKKSEDLIGKTFMPLIPEEDQVLIEKAIRQISVKNPTIVYEHRVVNAGGEVCWQRWTDRGIYDEGGNVIEFQSVGRDITEIKNIELERAALLDEISQSNIKLVEALKMTEIGSRAKSTFLSHMSHELRTPLTSIIGMSQLMQKQYYGPLNQKQKEYLLDIMESAQHLVGLINDVLDLAKIESGRVELVLKSESVGEIMSYGLRMMAPLASKNEVSIELDMEPGLDGKEVVVDRLRFQQIMINLLSNAIKFNKQGGTVLVKVNEQHGWLVIKVTDTGCGISLGDQDRVFDDFYVAGRNHEIAGTGLGLPLSKHLVELHGGTIRLESEGCGMGSSFIITFPMRETKP